MITKAAFIAAVPALAAMTPQAAEQTLAGWINSGRIVVVTNEQTRAVTIDESYIAREARRTRTNAAKASGLI